MSQMPHQMQFDLGDAAARALPFERPVRRNATLSELLLTPNYIFAVVQPFLLWALGAVVLAFIGGFALGPHLGWRDGDGSITIALPDLPIVEPLTLRDVTVDVAKRSNAAVPLTQDAIPAAKPWFLTGTPADRERAIDCLAATIYYEAGNEAIEGQMAVVQVVLNRARHPSYPKSICDVVFQGHERSTGCQFSYTCDGSMSRRRPPAELWERFRGLARAMTNGIVYAPVGLATHYHTDWVLPYWSAKLDKLRVERTHLFFRFNGYWGSPAAFTGKPTGTEASYAKMALISTAHAGAVPADAEADAEVALEQDLAALQSTAPDRFATSIEPENKGKDVFILYVDPLLEPEALSKMAASACGKLSKCKVLAWSDPDMMPKGLPITAGERASMAFLYQRGTSSTGTRMQWNCELFLRDQKSDCLPPGRAR